MDLMMMGGASMTRNYFLIIPEELWEIILDLLSDSKDVQSVLAASPELDSVFQVRKPRWLIDQVFPFIYFYVGQNAASVLSCRVASKRWCTVVDNFLSDHSSRRPYNLNGVSRRTLPYQELAYRDLEEYPVLIKHKIVTTARIRALLEEMQRHPRNPFLTRAVRLTRQDIPSGVPIVWEPIEPFVDACIAFLRVVGHHIRDVHLDFGSVMYEDASSSRRIRDKIVHCFSLLPNLRSFDIIISEDDANISEEEQIRDLSFPALPHLETLKISSESIYDDSLLDSLFDAYALNGQIKKMNVPLLYYYSAEHLHNCENLSELAMDFNNFSWKRFLRIFETASFPSLRKLRLMPLVLDSNPLNLFPLHEIVSRFEIEELEIKDASGNSLNVTWISDSGDLQLIPSVKWLRIQDGPHFDFELLKALPNLEHLQVIGDYIELGKQFTLTRKKKLTIATQIRSYLYLEPIPENVNIWNILPQLKQLTVEERKVGNRRFFRECGNKSFEFKFVT